MKECKCNHKIWVYEGSYSVDYDFPDGVFYHEVKYNNENCYKFNHNKYICLDCGKIIEIHNYIDFENKNQILKNRNIQDVQDCVIRYLKSKKDKPLNALKLFVEEFNKTEIKVKCNICKCKKIRK